MKGGNEMKIKVVVQEAEEGGFWAEVPSFPGCSTQGENFEKLLQNPNEAVEGCLAVDIDPPQMIGKIGIWKSLYEIPLRKGVC